ncbi:MAG: type II toxin-antitoxin system mRNA interferase toxin, RelE/StbE family [Anaerolineae bacterium]|nr:MAG: type II toxin-antitoxin system mRNA interferase toxin, RelE/StbE family [Anaerolineae bacterium]
MAGAEAGLACLDKPVAHRVLKKLRWLVENFAVITPETLTVQWQGVFKLRVGDYRVFYTYSGRSKDCTVVLVLWD